jgi:uncharacterized protein (DUF1810 family)
MVSDTNLSRFIAAQEPVYDRVITELTSGDKRTHWIWYIFPQIDGLGRSHIAQYYALKDCDEVEDYISDSLLYSRLKECTQLVMIHSTLSLEDILHQPDDMKFISSMTAFMLCQSNDKIFQRALEQFNNGDICPKTVESLG